MVKCDCCGRVFPEGRPYSRQTNRVTQVTLNLCLRPCRWVPKVYPTHDWENWEEEIVNPKPQKKKRRWAHGHGQRRKGIVGMPNCPRCGDPSGHALHTNQVIFICDTCGYRWC